MERLYDQGPPPFLTKTYDIADDLVTNLIVSCSRYNNSFVVLDPQNFAIVMCFSKQLNTWEEADISPSSSVFTESVELKEAITKN
ncbi:hypothetical protein ACE6H2_000190 [Prunus campanulata]